MSNIEYRITNDEVKKIQEYSFYINGPQYVSININFDIGSSMFGVLRFDFFYTI